MPDSCLLCSPNLSAAGELVVNAGPWTLLLHPDCAVSGHSMLVASRHVENFCDLSETEAVQLSGLQRVAERALLEITNTDRVILLKLGIQVPHFHLHLYPVRRTLDRAAVLQIINGEVSEPRPTGFAAALRDRMEGLTRG